MTPTFDIFCVSINEELIWMEAASTLDGAMSRVQQIGSLKPGQYHIHSQKAGIQVSLRVAASEVVNAKVHLRSDHLTVRPKP
ncbi:MAG: hypothetical protein WCE52_19455 [Candidatus Acidiferrum sp.]